MPFVSGKQISWKKFRIGKKWTHSKFGWTACWRYQKDRRGKSYRQMYRYRGITDEYTKATHRGSLQFKGMDGRFH